MSTVNRVGNLLQKTRKRFSKFVRAAWQKLGKGIGSKLKLVHKLLLSFALIFLILLIIGGMGVYTANKLSDSTQEIYEENLITAVDMMETARMFESLNSQVASIILGRDDNLEFQLESIHQTHDDLKVRIEALLATADTQLYEKLDTFEILWKNYNQSLEYLLSMVDEEQELREGVHWKDVATTYYNSMLMPQVNTMNKLIENWVITINQKAEESYGGAIAYQNQLSWILTILMVVALAIIVVLSYILVRSIRSPLTNLAERLNRLAEGDLRGEALQVTTDDEIGKLAQSFNLMNKSLGELIREVSMSAEQVAATSQQLTSHTKEISGITEEVTNAIQQIASGAEAQASGAEQSTAGMADINAKISNISQSVNEVEQSALEMATRAEQGDQSIQQVSHQMAMIGQSMQNAANVIADLTKSAAQISHISAAISDISSQTNLLALNASIEAARAGEAGRGFAVVADEVKKLANQAAESAKEVNKLISQMQANTNQVVEEMNKVAEDFEEGQAIVETAREQFGNILNAARNVSKQVADIVDAAQEMAASSNQVLERIKETEQIAKEASDNIQNVSASSEEQLAFMQEIQASADTLSNMAVSLHQLIGRFRTSDDDLTDLKEEQSTNNGQ